MSKYNTSDIHHCALDSVSTYCLWEHKTEQGSEKRKRFFKTTQVFVVFE